MPNPQKDVSEGPPGAYTTAPPEVGVNSNEFTC